MPNLEMTTIEQARQVEQRLRITTHMSDRNGFLIAADTIAALCAELEAAQRDAAQLREVARYAVDATRTCLTCGELSIQNTHMCLRLANLDAAIAAGGMK